MAQPEAHTTSQGHSLLTFYEQLSGHRFFLYFLCYINISRKFIYTKCFFFHCFKKNTSKLVQLLIHNTKSVVFGMGPGLKGLLGLFGLVKIGDLEVVIQGSSGFLLMILWRHLLY